ncbi:GNAT family N-acetyltransferase [Ktedonosporobacter rubrisoli]|uniref:GNAT family N-acetyltransferase n=1 Tax=Ktedonosporobacter rubrisoli TaxID=2509675 RepID=A0A4P6K260_KTERU|nr:GNAT family N-acetyltransferase [Ktedonosporobacter rubrisoli]QBD82278.1 GNAT family N-acetyltransferase [Ktedonosporobacter rubrisoli]
MQEIRWRIRLYIAATDASAVFLLWQAALGELWPIDFERFQQILAAPFAQHFVAWENGEAIGFVATSQSERWGKRSGHLLALMVTPSHQGQGLGLALHEKALTYLYEASLNSIELAWVSPCFWWGIPINLPHALAFFQAQGWKIRETVYDLTRDLSHYTVPSHIYQRLSDQQISLAQANPKDAQAILNFVDYECADRLSNYQYLLNLGDYQDILLARTQDGIVVGALLLSTPQSHPARMDVVWRATLGWNTGSIDALSVAGYAQGRGIGTALLARACELLKERGVYNSYIGWVWPSDAGFYARLGYRKWRVYEMSSRRL